MTQPATLELSDAVRASFDPVMKALGPVRQKLATVKNVVTIRPGYKYPADGKPTPALVVAVIPGTAPAAVNPAALETEFGVAFTVTDATVEEQMAAAQGPVSFGVPEGPTVSIFEKLLDGEEAIEFGPPKTGSYQALDPPDLPIVKEPMELKICVSPEAGWGELETFLGGTEKRLTVAMYQFTAPHIFEAVSAAVTPPGRNFELVLHPIPEKPPKSGVKASDLDEVEEVVNPLAQKLKALSLSKTISEEDSPKLGNRRMLVGDGCDPQAADRGATQSYYVARAA